MKLPGSIQKQLLCYAEVMLKNVLNIFFPAVCAGCETVLLDTEEVICTTCLHRLPVIDNQEYAEELVRQHFYGRFEIAHAASLLFFYQEGLTQQLMHRLKYRGDERISGFLGNWLGEILKEQEWTRSVDIILPVPLHKKRKRKRGYNQVTGFGTALSKKLGCAYREDILFKIHNVRTQVFKGRQARAEIEDTFFEVKKGDELYGRHILLIDDIVTTGATLSSCIRNLLKAGPAQISLATMAVTV